MDRRFAIVIGINDYSKKPLDYCVDDAAAVAKVLEEKCGFNHGDVHLITSKKDKPIKDISGHFDRVLKQIAKELRPLEDSIFFYFAGHGQYHFEKSGLEFHDSLTEIGDVFDRINLLQPKYQCYVIDACESGGKVLTRGVKGEDIIEKYISKSSGVLFMYAATESENAKEYEKIKHGLFTYHFLTAVDNDTLYDEDGILTPNRIQDFIARQTSKESKFKQTPVIENRTVGYYPFAFKSKPQPTEKMRDTKLPIPTNEGSSIDQEYFPEIPAKIRNQILLELKSTLDEIFAKTKAEFNLAGYELTLGRDFSIFGTNLQDKLTDSIVDESRKESVEAVNLLFSSERIENVPDNMFGALSIIEALTKRNKPKYTYHNRILWRDERIAGYCLNMQSSDVRKASCGIVIIVYQAVWGIGLAKSSFYMDYTGYSDTQINGPFTSIRAFKINDKTVSKIKDDVVADWEYFRMMIDEWNTQRQKSIAEFDRKSN